MQTNTSAAGLNPSPGSSNTQVFFDAKSGTNISSVFNVGVEPWYIQGFNMANGDKITVQIAAGPGSGAYFADYRPLGTPVVVTNQNTKLRLDQPGNYRLVFSGASVNAIFCNGFAATGSETSTYGVSPLNGGGSGTIGSVQGISPIVVTGSGTIPDPFTVSINGITGTPGTPGGSSGDNLFIGQDAAAGTTGTLQHDVGLGNGALQGAVNAVDVVAIGRSAGGNTTGSGNIFIGFDAGLNAHGTQSTVAIGPGAAQASTLSDKSVAIGYNAAQGRTAGKGIFIGSSAGSFDAFTNVIIIDQNGTNSLAAPANNVCMLGDSTITQTRTAGSIIAGGVVSASDSRLKLNVKTLEDPTAKLAALRLVSFTWDESRLQDTGLPHLRSDMGKTHTGVIAQELQKVFPELVEESAGTDGEMYLHVRYDRLVPLMLASMQAMHARICDLEMKGT